MFFFVCLFVFDKYYHFVIYVHIRFVSKTEGFGHVGDLEL